MTIQLVLGLIDKMTDAEASDMYLTVGHPPMLRVDDKFINIGQESLDEQKLNSVLGSILTPRQLSEFDTNMEMNVSLAIEGKGRFRVNVLKQRQQPACVIRRIISEIPDFNKLRLPALFEELSLQKRGLILVTGMTGSGKSTTLASMIDYRNQNCGGHIITIEDPIEYYHEHKKSVVSQREVGVDTGSFSNALNNALRQRPDVILVGEIRDREVMEQALLGAETGHLCLATLHTRNAYQAIERMTNMYPRDRAETFRLSLSTNLSAIISQRLVPHKDEGVVLALEILLNQGLIKQLIQTGEIDKMREVMEQNITTGMQTFDGSLYNLFENGTITEETAIANADIASNLKIRLNQKKIDSSESGEEKDAFGSKLLSIGD